MANATYNFTQADGAFTLSGATKTSYGGDINVASNAIVVTSGADETGYLMPFVASGLDIGADVDFTVAFDYNKSMTLFIGDFGGGGSGPRGYAVAYRAVSGPYLRLYKCSGRYGIDTVTDITITQATSGKLGIDWVINSGVSTVVRVWYNGSVVHTFTDTTSPIQLTTGTARAGFIQDYPNTGGTLDNLFVTDTYGVDSTAPVVTSVSGTGTSSSTADLTATINEPADVYFYVSNSATPPSQANHLAGTGAAAFDSVLGASSGAVNTNVTGLSAGTWYLHVIAEDPSNNITNPAVTSSGFVLSTALNITGITGTVGYGQNITISAIDLGSEGSVTLSQGSYSDTLTIVDWDSVANTVEVGIPAIASSELIPGSATLTVTNAATQSDTYATTLVMPSGKNTVTLTGVATEGIIPTDEPLAAGMVVMFDTVISSGGTPTAYTFDVTNQAVMVVDGAAPDGDYTVAARVWNTGVWGAEANVPFTLGEAGITLTPTAGTISVAGNTPTLTQTEHINLAPATGSVSITGNTPTLAVGENVYLFPTVGSVSVSGNTPTLTVGGNVDLSPTSGSVTVTGNTPTLSVSDNIYLFPTSGTVQTAGNTPILTTGDSFVLAPSSGAISVSGNTPTVAITDNIYLFPSVGSVSYQGETPVVSQTGDVVLSPSTGSVSYTGNVVTLSIPITLTPTSGNIVINGNTPVVSQRPSTPTIIKYIDLQFTI